MTRWRTEIDVVHRIISVDWPLLLTQSLAWMSIVSCPRGHNNTTEVELMRRRRVLKKEKKKMKVIEMRGRRRRVAPRAHPPAQPPPPLPTARRPVEPAVTVPMISCLPTSLASRRRRRRRRRALLLFVCLFLARSFRRLFLFVIVGAV